MTDEIDADDGTKRFRSPPYPTTNLARALDRAKALYAKALHHQVSIAVLADAWKYGTKSSGLSATTATLIQFGLLVGHGTGPKRRYALSEAGMRLVRDNDPLSEKRRSALEKVALSPAVYQELWESFGAAAEVSDVVLRNFLTIDRLESGKAPFSDQAANDIIQSYKETIGFAGIAAEAAGSDDDEEAPEAEFRSEPTMAGATAPSPAPERSGLTFYDIAARPDRPVTSAVQDRRGERELVAGLLSKEASFRVVVQGVVGVKEIERLIRKLELDKEILADSEAEGSVNDLV